MQNKTIDFDLMTYLRKYWFQISIIAVVLYTLSSKDFSFQFNVNNPDLQNSTELPGNGPQNKKKEKQTLITQNQSTTNIAKSEAGFFSKIPFIGSGSATSKKSELPKVDPLTIESYIKRFAHVAINERKKYGVPSSIIMANALFHSYAGQRDMAISGNNHFGISCSEDWIGTNGTYAGTCYRHYENAWTSFRDHSLFVTSGNFSELRQLGSTDYNGWAKGLETSGFSEFENLAENLIKIIEQYGLNQLDVK